MLRFPLVAAAIALAALVVVGAGAPAGARTAPKAFPVTIVTAEGKVTVAKRPLRVISLSPTATESLFAIGAGPQVVAVDNQSDYPKSVPKTSLSGYTPNVEAIAGYRPDLVVAAYDPKGLSAALRKLGIPVVVQGAASTFKGAYQQIRQLGLVTGHVSDAARNIADSADTAGTGYPQLSAEYVVSQSPDLIVLADSVCCGQTAATVAARPGWDRIKAVRSGSIVRIDDSIASRWGPRLVNFFRALASALGRLS